MAQMFAIGAAAAAIGIAAAVERVNRPQTLYDAARRDHVLALKELLNQGAESQPKGIKGTDCDVTSDDKF
ncbi:Protein of unknown function [Gryllus bimaculatus]|nr:Protein of unknown function [Gryllus bimaculatus]